MSRILSTGGSVYPPRQTPLGGQPLGRHPHPKQTPPPQKTATAVDGMHPTRIHSCLNMFLKFRNPVCLAQYACLWVENSTASSKTTCNNWRTFFGHKFFMWYPCFGLLVTYALDFKSRMDPIACMLCRLCTEDSLDSPLVQHLLTSCGQKSSQAVWSTYRLGTVNSNTVNSKFQLIQSYYEILFYHFSNISCLKCTVNSNFHLIRSKTLLMNDFELTVPNLYLCTSIGGEILSLTEASLFVLNTCDFWKIALAAWWQSPGR